MSCFQPPQILEQFFDLLVLSEVDQGMGNPYIECKVNTHIGYHSNHTNSKLLS